MAHRMMPETGTVPDEADSACEFGLPDEVGAHLAEHLADGSVEIAGAWYEALRERLALRPESVFPSDDVLNQIPDLVRHLVRSLAPETVHLPKEIREDVEELVTIRRAQGYGIAELLLETDLLADILFDRLHDALRSNRYISTGAAVAATACLSDAIRQLDALLVAIAREHEEREADERLDVIPTLQHELRDPLTVLLQGVEMLKTMDLPAERRQRTYDRLQRAVRRAEELVDELPGILRPKESSVVERTSLRDVIEGVLEDVNAGLPDHDVELRIDGQVPDVIVDGPNTSLVMYNLLTNAVKHSDPGKERRWARVRIDDLGGGEWRIEIGDNGLGVPSDEQERIFERFVRSHAARARGHGLGLSIARDAVRRMGGRIGCESREGVGSTFFFTVRDLRAESAA